MKKNVFISIVMAMFSIALLNAQTSTLWSEDFEGSWYNDWHTDYGTWEAGIPTSGPGSAYTGENCAATVLSGNYSEPVDSKWIRHTQFVVPSSTENPRLRFWHWYSFSSADYGKVQIKVVGTNDWVDISPTYYSHSSNIWTNAYLDLNAYADSTVQIGFYFYAHNHNGGYVDISTGWYIDDVEVLTGPLVYNNPEDWESGIDDWISDFSIWEVGTPTSGPGSAHTGESCAGTILAGNYYDNTASMLSSPSFTVPTSSENPRLRFWHFYSFSSADYGKVQIKVEGSNDWVDISPTYYSHSSNIWTNAYLDLNAYADSTVQIGFYFYAHNHNGGYVDISTGWYIDDVEVLTGPLVYNNPEDWESGIDDWISDFSIWEVGTPTSGPGSAHTGESCAGTILAGNYYDNTASMLSSPSFTVPTSSENPRLRFWHFYSFSSADYGKVQIKVEGSNDWVDIPSAYYTGTSGNVWTYTYLPLFDYVGSTIQIGFYFYTHNHNGGYPDVSTGWYIDDIIIDDNSGLSVDAGPDLEIEYGNNAQINASFTGGTSPFTIEWNPASYLSNAGIINPLVTPLGSIDYVLKVTDAHGCFRTDDLKIAVFPFFVDTKVFLQGPFSGIEMETSLNIGDYIPLDQPFNVSPWDYTGDESVASIPDTDIVDWVLLEIREVQGGSSQATGSTAIASKAVFLKKDGRVVDLDGSSLPEFDLPVYHNLYVVVWHRTHLGIMSSMSLNQDGITYSCDFSSAAGYTYGGSSGIKALEGGYYGMVAGDGNGSGIIENTDETAIWKPQLGLSGYLNGDFDLNGVVQNTDETNIWKINLNIGGQVPAKSGNNPYRSNVPK